MTHDEQPEPAEGRWEFRFADQVAPSEVLAEHAERAFEATPVLEGEPSIGWRDPRAARFRRAVAAEANRKGKAKRLAREAEAQVQALKQELSNAYELIEKTSGNYKALESKYRELYVRHALLLSKQDESADLASSEEPADPATTDRSGAHGAG